MYFNFTKSDSNILQQFTLQKNVLSIKIYETMISINVAKCTWCWCSQQGPDAGSETRSKGSASFLKPQDSRHKRLDRVEAKLCVGSGYVWWHVGDFSACSSCLLSACGDTCRLYLTVSSALISVWPSLHVGVWHTSRRWLLIALDVRGGSWSYERRAKEWRGLGGVEPLSLEHASEGSVSSSKVVFQWLHLWDRWHSKSCYLFLDLKQ